jgi:hypothetical protein
VGVSSELAHSLLPMLLVSTLVASALAVGVIAGIAEASALVVKVFFRRHQRLLQR